MTDRGKCLFFQMGLVILLFSLVTGIAAATTVAVTPDKIAPGGMFTVSVQGLPNNTPIAIQIQGEFGVQGGKGFAFNLTDMTWPMKLEKSNATVRLENTVTNKVTLTERDPDNESQDMTYIVEGPSVGGIFERVISGLETTMPEIEPDEEHACLFSGTAASDAQVVVATVKIDLEGEGEPDFQIPVQVSGIDNGLVHIVIFVDNQVVLTRTLTVGTPVLHEATLHVMSVPTGAAIYIDGVYAGETPTFIQVFTGPRLILISKPGFYPWQTLRSIAYSPGQAIPVFATLTVQPLGVSVPAPASGSGSSGVLVPVQPYIPFPVNGGTYTPGIIITPNPQSIPGGVITINRNAIVQHTAPIPFL
jgi:hypothetical protein